MKILNAEQIREVDRLTIEREPVTPIALMERAARACEKRISALCRRDDTFYIFCGMGNNGGDGFAIAYMLLEKGRKCYVKVVRHRDKFSTDAETNYSRLVKKYPSSVADVSSTNDLKEQPAESNIVAIDAILGTGITEEAEGITGEAIRFINSNFSRTISIDIPSGMFVDKSSVRNRNVVKSSLTLTFQLPKPAFLLPENGDLVPEFEILDIGLNEAAIEEQTSGMYYVTMSAACSFLSKRKKYSHKGDHGHALLVAGSRGRSGAALIAAKACLRSGAGWLTVHSTKDTLYALLQYCPEAMGDADMNEDHIAKIDSPEKYSALGFGPGAGTHEDVQKAFKDLLQAYGGPLVIDADGLNILAENKTWLAFLPPASILAPHPGEFARLAGNQDNDFERLGALKNFSVKYNCIVILKGAHSVTAMPDGNLFFNSSGNAGLAKAGSGDGLTGVILGLLSRGYNPAKAALTGTFVHGYAADLCLEKMSMESMLMSDVTAMLPEAFLAMEKHLIGRTD